MEEAIRRNSALIVGCIIAAWLCVQPVRVLIAGDGAPAGAVLLAESPVLGWIVTALAVLVTAIVAGTVGRLSNAAVGLFTLGAGLFVLARRLGTIQDVVFAGDSLGILAVELVIWTMLILCATIIVFRMAGPLPDIEAGPGNIQPHSFLSREAMVSAGCGLLVLVGVWIVAQTPMKGQALAATFVGATLAGLAGRLLAPHVQPILLFATPCLFGAAGHVIGAVTVTGSPADAYVLSNLSAFSLPLPVDYAAGSLLGVSFGLGWAKSFLHYEDDAPAPKPAASGEVR